MQTYTRKLISILLSLGQLTTSTLVADDATIKIALTGPFTGASSDLGISFRNGAKLAIKKINEEGGIEIGSKKMKIEALEYDDEGKNEKGAQIADMLSQMSDLAAVIGSANTGVVIAGDKYFQEAKKIKIITPATGTQGMAQWWGKQISDLYLFRFSPQDTLQATLIVDFAVKELKVKKVGILHDSTSYGLSGRDDLLKNLKKYPDVQIVAIEKFNPGDKEMSAQIDKLKSAQAEAILVWGIGPDLANVANDMHTLNLNIPYIGGWTLSMRSYIDSLEEGSEGALMPQSFIDDPKLSKNAADFIDLYKSTYHVTHIPSAMSAAEGHDAILILAEAFKEAESQDSTKVKNALENLKEPVVGVIKTWKHPYSKWDPDDPDTHEAFRLTDLFMAKVKEGKVVFAEVGNKEMGEKEEKKD